MHPITTLYLPSLEGHTINLQIRSIEVLRSSAFLHFCSPAVIDSTLHMDRQKMLESAMLQYLLQSVWQHNQEPTASYVIPCDVLSKAGAP